MKKNKFFIWPQGILIALVAFCGTLWIGLMMPGSPNASEVNSKQSINSTEITAEVGTQQRIEGFKAAMMTTWQQEAKAKGLSLSGAPPRFQGAIISEAKLNPNQKVIALTFDDGPWPNSTAQVLKILKDNNIKATFFIVGQNLKNFPELGKQIVADGHVIANHTWHHWYHFMNQQTAAYEIDHTSDLIYETTGVRTTLFRPPGGIMHNGVVNYARNKKYAIVLWSADSIDYSRPPVSKLIHNVMKEAKPGGIVLMHDGGGNRINTVQALPQIINTFKKQGYSFVTIPEILEMQDKDYKLMTAQKQ